MSVNSRFKAIQIDCQRKAFSSQRITGSSSARKETVDIKVLITWLQKYHAICQNNKQTSLKNKEVESVEPVQLNTNQSNTYKGLSLLIFDDEPKVQERQKVKDHQSYLFVFVAYLTFPNSSKEQQPKHENNIPYKVVWQIFRDRESNHRRNHRTNQSSNFPGGSFNNRYNVKAPIQKTTPAS